MLYPGIKKVRDKFHLSDDGTFVLGTVKNSRIRLSDGVNCKILLITAPSEISDDARTFLNKFSKSPYKARIQINTESVAFTFKEYLLPYSWKKICDVITDCSDYFFNENPMLEASPEDATAVSNSKMKSVDMKYLFKIILVCVLAATAPFFKSEFSRIKFASDMVKSMAVECPIQVDEVTVLDSVRAEHGKVYMYYKVSDADFLSDGADEFLKAGFIENLRTNGTNSMLFDKKIWFFLIYSDSKGDEILRIRIVPVDYK